MAEYIGCRNCESPDCKGCNLKNLETMLNNGKFDCLMNENRCINPAADVAPVRHGYWRPILHKDGKTDYECSCCFGIIMDVPDDDEHDLCAWCSMCGAKMDLEG